MNNQQHLYAALQTILVRCRHGREDLRRAEVIRMCEDALAGVAGQGLPATGTIKPGVPT